MTITQTMWDLATHDGRVLRKVEHPRSSWHGIRVIAETPEDAFRVWQVWSEMIQTKHAYQCKMFDVGQPVSDVEYVKKFGPIPSGDYAPMRLSECGTRVVCD